MRGLLLATIATGAIVSISGSSQNHTRSDQTDLSGIYDCEGIGPDGAAYHGMVDIVRNADTYQVLWASGDEGQFLGIGLVADHTLAVSYFGGAPGVVLYRIERNERHLRLVGRWTSVHADGQVFSETLTKVGARSGEMHFKVVPLPKKRIGRSVPA